MKYRYIFTSTLLLAVCACSLPGLAAATPTPAEPSTPAATETATLTFTPPATLTPTETPTLTFTPLPTETFTPAVSPTPVVLRGKVVVARASCRYGPGAMYLYLYGLLEGANQDVLGRTDTGKWLLTMSRGDNKRCWVKADLMKLNGDVMSLPVAYPEPYHIPQSNQGYRAPWDVAAVRSGNQVTISWKSEGLRPGDEEDANMVIYIVEVWTCQGGQVSFNPIGTSLAMVTVSDEPGCSQPSHGRVFFQEKHGYAGPSEIPWPLP